MNRTELLAWLETVPEDEPVFILRAKDDASLKTISSWMKEAALQGSHPEKIYGVDLIWDEFAAWRDDNRDKCKVPD